MNYLKTTCNSCGGNNCNCHDNGFRNYYAPILMLEPENNYNVVLTEIFETSGSDGCTTSSKSREVIASVEVFVRDAIAAVDPGDSVAVDVPGLVADFNQLLQNLRDAGLLK